MRRRLWVPLFVGLATALLCGLALFRQIGPLEWGVILIPVALVLFIESGRYIARQFLKGYRDQSLQKKTDAQSRHD